MNVLSVSGLTKNYRRSLKQLVDKKSEKDRSGIFDINFSIDKGEVYGLLGSAGAGKTTIIRSILGYIRPASGEVIFLGKKNIRILNTLLKHTGYMPEEYDFYEDANGWQFLKFMAAGRAVDPAFRERLAEGMGLDNKKLGEKVWWYTPVQQQKLVMVAAMQHKPSFLVLDEPTRFLNMPERQTFYGLIDTYTADGGAVLLSSTSAPEVETICSKVAVLHKGKIIAEETPESLRRKSVYNFAVNMEPVLDDGFFEQVGSAGYNKGGKATHFQAAGDINSLLQQLQGTGRIKGLELERAPIADVISRFYAKEDKHA